jgi:site-specific recombinase
MSATDIREAVRTLVGHEDLSTFESTICTVSDINLITKTCKCVPVNGDADFLDVLLCVGEKDGFVLVPKNNSLVAVTQLNETDAFVSMVSEVDSILLNGDTNGGLVKVIDLTTKLNNCENKINLILTFLAGLGATPPLTTPLTPTVRANIESITVKHG